jgi:regulation of enolase protein 1 (concanavalin A-like superfamily)
MKNVTMKDFRWLGKPAIWNKDYRETTLVVEGKTELPSCPLLLAVSDEDFEARFMASVAPKDGQSGPCIYHSDLSYCAVGLSADMLAVHVSVRGYRTVTHAPIGPVGPKVLWAIERCGERIKVSYAADIEDPTFVPVAETSLPGMQRAVSFGIFFANHGKDPYDGCFGSFRYSKKAVSRQQPL